MYPLFCLRITGDAACVVYTTPNRQVSTTSRKIRIDIQMQRQKQLPRIPCPYIRLYQPVIPRRNDRRQKVFGVIADCNTSNTTVATIEGTAAFTASRKRRNDSCSNPSKK